MKIKHDKLKYTLDTNPPIKLSMKDLLYDNPEVFIQKIYNLYSISLYIQHPYENDEGDHVEEDIHFNDVAILTQKQMLMFLY